MTRRIILAGLTGAFSAGLIGGGETVSPPPLQHAQAHPNVVLFMVDDANVEDIAYMPQVQNRLVAQGVTFAKNYSRTRCVARHG
jgi:hypothetical protein